MSCKTILGKYAEKLEREIKKMNKEIELLYKKLDAQDAIIDQQALEISQLKEQKKQAIEYLKRYQETQAKYCYVDFDNEDIEKLLELLGDGNNEPL